jgi:hypothetical protein
MKTRRFQRDVSDLGGIVQLSLSCEQASTHASIGATIGGLGKGPICSGLGKYGIRDGRQKVFNAA